MAPGAWDLVGGSVEPDDLGCVNSRTGAKYFPFVRTNSLRRSVEVLWRGSSSSFCWGTMYSHDGKLIFSFGACAFRCAPALSWSVLLSTSRPSFSPFYVFVSDILF